MSLISSQEINLLSNDIKWSWSCRDIPDIDYLVDWALRNKMKFHPSKSKVLSISLFRPPLVDILPNIQYFYSMGRFVLDFVSSEKDLGILMNSTLNIKF